MQQLPKLRDRSSRVTCTVPNYGKIGEAEPSPLDIDTNRPLSPPRLRFSFLRLSILPATSALGEARLGELQHGIRARKSPRRTGAVSAVHMRHAAQCRSYGGTACALAAALRALSRRESCPATQTPPQKPALRHRTSRARSLGDRFRKPADLPA